MDSYPTFFDIVEIFMAQGILFSSDKYQDSPITEQRCVTLIEKYTEYFTLLGL